MYCIVGWVWIRKAVVLFEDDFPVTVLVGKWDMFLSQRNEYTWHLYGVI